MRKVVLAVGGLLLVSLALSPVATAAKPKVPRAKLADKAKNATKVGGIRASRTPKAKRLLALDAAGKFPESVIPSVFQRRVHAACEPGNAIRAIAEDGNVFCQPDANAGGDITGVTAGPGLTGGGTGGDVTISLELPFSESRSTSGSLFILDNPGSGQATEFRSRSTFATTYISNGGTGGALRADTSSTGQGSAITAYNYGTTRYGLETEIVNSSNPSAAIYARTAGNGQAIDAEINSNTNGDALFARTTSPSASSFAGIFVGNVSISGNLAKSSGSFVIDHPLDPANKFLQHSFVESPDMKNIYDGVVRTDEDGYATVELPDYFGALNRDFRYQLTPIRSFSRATVWEEIEDNRFTIRTEDPDVRVSWQVTGIRKDAWANAHRIEVEKAKPASERGRFLAPEELGYPASKAIEKR